MARYACTVCGTLRSGPIKNPAAHICRSCRPFPHGATGYKRGCRCDACKDGKAAEQRRTNRLFRERNGYSLPSKYRKPTTARHGNAVPRKVRLEIYERDAWTCQLCHEPVDPDLHPNDRMAATLDHVECQSWALVPDHSVDNLRLAHRACNSRRNNRAA